MDSIGENVMAIICVVVGILIIGCALVPIVDNASFITTDTTETQPTSGYNTISGSESGWYGVVDALSIEALGGSMTVNGESFTESSAPIELKPDYVGAGFGRSTATFKIRVYALFDDSIGSGPADYIDLATGTVTYSNGTLSITGVKTDSTEYSHTKSVSELYTNYALSYSNADDTEIYGVTTSPFVIGENQTATVVSTGQVLDTSTTEYAYGTITQNADGTVTVTSSISVMAPYKWTGTLTTGEITTESTEYADLFQIIPVLCILGMAYVLIRRFY